MGQEVDQIKDRLGVAEVVGEYVQLKPAGQNLKGLCPFHTEKTPSFFVSPKRGTWHCFGACGEGGDIFSFIEKAEGVDFSAALKILAEKAGVALRQQPAGQSNRRQRLFEVMSAATGFYHAVLDHKAGEQAKDYLKERGLVPKTIRQFEIGYAPMQWDILQQALTKKGFTVEELEAAGLIGRTSSGKLFDRFRGRIMFPIRDARGRVVAFGGRIAPWAETGNEGKYINSPETALYEKRVIVYNLDAAKQVLRKGEPCVVVEGYMDVVMLVQAGIENVVATSGTAFTEGHVKQLQRYTDTLHFAFDADSAGMKAAIAATQAALLAGMNVATIVLPAGSDPADLVKGDVKKARETLSKTSSLLSVLLDRLRGADSSKDKSQQLEALIPFVRLVRNPVQQGAMVQEIADALHVPEERVLDLVRQAGAYDAAPMHHDTSQDEVGVVPASSERQLLGLLLARFDVFKTLFSYLEPEFFLDPACQKLYNSMQHLKKRDISSMSTKADTVIDLLPEEQQTFAAGLATQAEERLEHISGTPLEEGQQLIRSVRRYSLHERMKELQYRVAESVDKEKADALEQFRALSQELATIDL